MKIDQIDQSSGAYSRIGFCPFGADKPTRVWLNKFTEPPTISWSGCEQQSAEDTARMITALRMALGNS